MRAFTAVTQQASAHDAAAALASDLQAQLHRRPALLAVYASEALAHQGFAAALAARFPDVPVFGGTTCRGVITDQGVQVGPTVAGVLAIEDPEGDYGTALTPIGDDPVAAGRNAIEAALAAAGRPFEAPAQIWLCAPPGCEEDVLAGIGQVVGPRCPIVGGSSADDEIAGRWRQFGSAGIGEAALSLAVLFPSRSVGCAFESGYAPTDRKVTIGTADRRTIRTIDGGGAGPVFRNDLAGISEQASVADMLANQLPTPLGRPLGRFEGVSEYLLLHPAAFAADGTIGVFADVRDGEELLLMEGNVESVVQRAELVTRHACDESGAARPVGGLVILCAGFMFSIPGQLNALSARIAAAMQGAPFLAAFTFGEQGASLTAGNQHGNLMIASAVLADAPL